MKNLLNIIFLLLLSCSVWSIEPVNCSEPTEHAKVYFGDASKIKFGEIVEFKMILKSILLSHAKELERVVNLTPEYTGPDTDYIPRLIKLLEEPAGRKDTASCIWRLRKEGDYMREFIQDERMVFKKGYGLFRNGVLVTYYYSEILVV
ncbi:hypothetical protein [Agarilytica rhodophyticola]|uniref:hypothetical protein n=1 Tax=Agarilytica rhodophyticola TaxID=1737490 RepID=UPI000B345731|nr:hypothetical protein [Agarilytica rhodophyticola]